ncbi:MAG: transposase, partial [Bryobacterales bacterium]|nr:transposase [Bryobacterales bacterium]
MNRVYDREFKLGVVRRIQAGEAIAALSRELGIKRTVLYRWKYAVEQRGAVSLRSAVSEPISARKRPISCDVPRCGRPES